MSENINLRINLIWTRLAIILSIMCAIIFIAAFITLRKSEILIYILATLPPVIAGYQMSKQPYATVSKNKIVIFSVFGTIKKTYQIKKNERFELKNNRIYQISSNKSTKIKVNQWFVNKHDWQRVIDVFSNSESDKIINHLIDD
jgi:hypothetical protein